MENCLRDFFLQASILHDNGLGHSGFEEKIQGYLDHNDGLKLRLPKNCHVKILTYSPLKISKTNLKRKKGSSSFIGNENSFFLQKFLLRKVSLICD